MPSAWRGRSWTVAAPRPCVAARLGALWMPVDRRRQGVHDKLARTVVVSTTILAAADAAQLTRG